MILYRYILKKHILPFIYSLAIIIFILSMQFVVQLLANIIAKGLSPQVVLELYLINIAWVVALAIPMAILVSTLMAFGQMSADNEITAIKASGYNLSYLLKPVLAAAGVFMIITIYFNNDILPDANHHAANLLSDISRKKPAVLIEPNILITSFENYGIFVKKVNPNTGFLKDIKIFSFPPNEDPTTTVAESGEISLTSDQKFIKLILYNGETHSTNRKNIKENFLCKFKKQIIFIKNVDTELKRSNSNYRSDREMSSQTMLKEVSQYKKNREIYYKNFATYLDSLTISIDSLEKSFLAIPYEKDSFKDTIQTFVQWISLFKKDIIKDIALSEANKHNSISGRIASQVRYESMKISQLMVEVHKKFSIPVACIVFVLIGAPLGIMARQGNIMVSAAYSIFFFIIYWAFLISGETLADNLIISPFSAMWTANIIIGICGLFLIYLMTKETRFISFGFIVKLFNSFFRKQNIHSHVIIKANKNFFDIFIFYLKKTARIPFRILCRCIGILPAYLVRKFFGYLIGLFIAITITVILVDYISNLKRFDEMSFVNIALYYWYYLPWFFGFIFPVVLLLAAMSSIGSMARNNELVAIKASGISIRRLTFSLLIIGLLCAGLGFYVSEIILPKANVARKELMEKPKSKNDISAKKNTVIVSHEYRRNFFYFGDNKNIYFFGDFRTFPFFVKTVRRETFNENTVIERINAESALYYNGKWQFIKGARTFFKNDSTFVLTFDTLTDTILSESPQDMVAQIKSPEEMGYWELASYVDKSKRRGEDISKWRAQLDFKIALPFMNFIVILLGLSISARAGRKGGALLFGIGLMLSFSFWIISQFAIAFAQNGRLHPLIGAWLGNILFLLISIPLYLRASK
jgi:lipopolysaccharide export system permease protein